jgi:hypothetical protein
MTLLVDSQYFPPLVLFNQLSDVSHCLFDQYEHYQKMSFRNRCTLLGGNGPIALSIPLEGGRDQKRLIKDVRIMNRERWQDRHWKTITACYNKSPWLQHYYDELEKLYSTRFTFLLDWNVHCFQWITDKLAITSSWSLTDQYHDSYDVSEFIDWRSRLLPATINEVNPSPQRYPQVFEDRYGFVPNLSILDYLFCVNRKFTK